MAHPHLRRRGFGFYAACAVGLFVLAFVLTGVVESALTDRANEARNPEAVAAGFANFREMDDARKYGVADGTTWHKELQRRQELTAKENADRLAREETQRAAAIEAARSPTERMKIRTSSWTAGGFGTVGVMNVIITNENPYLVKDITITCSFSAKSGTLLSEKVHTIYDTIEPKKSKAFKNINIGFIDNQSARAGCSLIAAKK